MKILVWGTGEAGHSFYQECLGKQQSIEAFIDSDPKKQGGLFYEMPIISPQEINGFTFDYLVVASVHYREIESELKKLNVPLEKVISGYDPQIYLKGIIDHGPPSPELADKLIREDKITRPNYAFGLYLATIEAMRLNLKEITVIEFGVFQGNGLLNLCAICDFLTKTLGMNYRIFGFDTGEGLPDVSDYKDHPELWGTGYCKLEDLETLKESLPKNASLIIGDIKETLKSFTQNHLSKESPVGFVSVDVDLYSSAVDCLKLFTEQPPECFLPAVINWFDDVEHAITMNSWCGEMLAIREFNEANEMRKIDKKQVRTNRPQKWWHHQFYFTHILDHPERRGGRKGGSLSINMFDF